MQIKDEYTVNEVAEIFQTNPETVRKWIREGKLKATPGNSKKEGIRIDDSSIQNFLDDNSKYSKKALTSATAALLTGGFAIPAFLMVKAYQENQALASAIINSSDLLGMLKDEIAHEKDAISEILQGISLLEDEIQKKEKRIDSINHMISEISGNNTSENQNKEKTVSKRSSLTAGGVSGSKKMKLGRVHTSSEKRKTKNNTEKGFEEKLLD